MLTKYCEDHQIEKNVMGCACGTMGGGTVVGKLNRMEKCGSHIQVGWEDMDWSNVARDRDGS
jgi:uncharacterized protein YbdZ (MbtH family)